MRSTRRYLLQKLCTQCKSDGDIPESMLYTAACAFSFRAPSEGLPLCVYRPEMGPQPDHAVIVSQSSAVVALRRRKNLIQGNAITRSCTCCECTPPCQVHVLGRWLSSLSAGPRPWADGRLLSLSGSCKHAWLVSARALQRSTGCMTSGAGGARRTFLQTVPGLFMSYARVSGAAGFHLLPGPKT